MTNTSPIKLDTTARSLTVPAMLTPSIPLGNSQIDPLPTLPREMRGRHRPRVSYQMNNDLVETSIEFKGETVKFWSSDGERYNSVDELRDGSEPWPELNDDDSEAIIEWAYAVHDRIDAAVYGAAIQLSMNEDWSKAIASTVVQDYAPETFIEREHEITRLMYQFREFADTAARQAARATSARDAILILGRYPDAHEARFTDDTQDTMSLFDGDDTPIAEALPVQWTRDSRMREDISADPHGSYNLRDAANWRPSRF